MYKTMRLLMIKDILEADSNVNKVDVQDDNVVFWTDDPTGDEEGYEHDQHFGVNHKTHVRLKKLSVDVQWNDCPGGYNEGKAQ